MTKLVGCSLIEFVVQWELLSGAIYSGDIFQELTGVLSRGSRVEGPESIQYLSPCFLSVLVSLVSQIVVENICTQGSQRCGLD